MKPIRAICFDLDLTLLDYDNDAYLETVDCVCHDLGETFHEVDAQALGLRFWEINLERWAVEGQAGGADHAKDGHAYWRETWSMALAATGYHTPTIADRALALYVSYRHEHYRLFDDVLPALEALGRGYKLAVITNGPGTTQRDKLQFMQLEPYFEVCTISGEVGYNKPNAGIFEHTLRALGVTEDEALHVGDNPTADVAGALGAAMRAVWLNHTGATRAAGDPEPHYEITSLSELTALLDNRA